MSGFNILDFENREELSQYLAEKIIQSANEILKVQSRFNLVLTGGNSITPVFSRLAEYSNEKFWKKATIFWGDERCVPQTDSQSNYYSAKKHLLDHVDLRDDQIHRIIGELGNIKAAEQYNELVFKETLNRKEQNISTLFDFTILSLGQDGHIASLFPGQEYLDQADLFAIPVTAFYEDRPAERVSLTSYAINQSRMITLLVIGDTKWPALERMLNQAIHSDQIPAKRLLNCIGELEILRSK